MKKILKNSILLIIAILFVFSIIAVPFHSANAITSVGIEVKPNVVTLAAEFDITFITGKTLSGESDWVRIDFPSGFLLPCNCGGTGWSPSDFTINGRTPPFKPDGSNTDNQKHVIINLPNNLTINAGEKVTIVIKQSAKIKNPPDPGVYKLGVYTSKESTESYTPTFNIELSHVKSVVVSLTSNIVNTPAGMAVSFVTGELGHMAGTSAGSAVPGSISIVFPDQFEIPSFISSSDILIKTKSAKEKPGKTLVKGNTIVCSPKQNIQDSEAITVEISLSAEIKTPSTPGIYRFSIHTSKEPKDVESNQVEIKDTPFVATQLIKTPSFPGGKNDFYTNQPIIILVGQTNTGNPVITKYKIDEGEYQQYISPIIVPYGIHVISFYSQAGDIKEKERSLTIKFDNVPPIVTISSPESNSYLSSDSCAVEGSVKDDYLSEILINGNSVEAKDDGSFTYNVKLLEGKNTIKVVASDLAGNSTEKDIIVNYDTTVPQINITSPKNWQEFKTPDITVTGSVTPASNVDVNVNGEAVNVNADGTFTYSITAQREGMVSIRVTAVYKLSGKSSEKSIVVIYKPVKKTIILLKVGSKTISVNGKSKDIDVAPFIEPSTGRTLVPIRFISEAFGAEVNWEPEFKVVTIILNGTTIKLQIGNKNAVVNGQTVKLDQPPIIKDNRTMVPIRFISEAFGATVKWFPETREIKITYENEI